MAKDEVLVVGAGPVGLTMGIQLARFGVKFRIIDKCATEVKDSRAVGIQPRTLELFEDMGILTQVLKKGVKVTGINLYAKTKCLIHADYKGFDTPYCFIMDLPQKEIETLLLHELNRLGGKIERETDLNQLKRHDSHVEVVFKKGENDFVSDEFDYVVGCDGAQSVCRKLTETPFPGSEYPTHWIVLDAKLKWNYDSQKINLFPHADGLIAVFPLPHDRSRITIESGLEDISSFTFEFALQKMQERLSAEMTFEKPADIGHFMIHHRQVTAYQTGRVFLAGDAAHLHSPAGGQGMNTGIQDVYNLAWKLSLVMQDVASQEILKTYHEERYPIAKKVLAITDKITKVMTIKNSTLSFMRDTLMHIIGHFEGITKQLPRQLSQIYLSYKKNKIIVDQTKETPPTHVKIGGRALDHSLKQGEKEIRLFELFHGTHHTLLLFSGKTPMKKELEACTDFSSFKHLQVRSYFIYCDENNFPNSFKKNQCLLDLEPSAHSHYGISKATLLLVRPDGYLGFIQEPLNQKKFETYIQQVFLNKTLPH